MFQSLLVFGFGPYFRHALNHKSRMMYEAMAVGSTISAFLVIFFINKIASIFYLLFMAFLILGAPLLFIYAYKFKNDIRGPWDLPNI